MLDIKVFCSLIWITYTGCVQSATNLSCYDCSESFKYTWDPYTECQFYPTQAPLRTCLSEEKYCMVERVTYRSLTVSIARGCTDECWHGCVAYGFGLTRLKCTSCCLESGCNTGNVAARTGVDSLVVVAAVFGCFLLTQL